MSIAAKTATGAVWHLSASIAVRAVGLVGSLVLTSFLAPNDYGEALLAAACVVAVTRLTSLGVSSFVVARTASAADCFQALLLQAGLSASGIGALLLVRQPLAQLLNAPGMARYLPGLGLATFVLQLSAVPAAAMARQLRFAVPAVARVAGEATYTLTSVALAPALGAMAIVAGNLTRAVMTTGWVVLRSEPSLWWRPARLRWESVRAQVAFGLPLSGSAVAETISGYGDNLIVSRLFGPGVMAHYNLGYNVATTPTAYVAEYAGDVLLPGMSAVPEGQRRQEALLRALGVVCLLVLPMVFGLAVVAPTLVAAVLDARWAPVGPMITILCGIALARTAGSALNPYLLTSGRSRTLFLLGWLRAGSLVILLLTLGRLGPLWACVASSLAATLSGFGAMLAVSRGGGPDMRRVFSAIRPALFAALGMVAVVVVVRLALSSVAPSALVELVAEMLAGVAAYLALARLLAERHVGDLVGILRQVLARRAGAQTDPDA